MLKVMTIVGTRPELIKMSRVIAEFDLHTQHILVHTGQNYDYELNQLFFEDLEIRKPDYFIRLEHIFEDYSKIPFIRDSELFKSGELELKCKLPINKNTRNLTYWQDLYTQETADLIYYNFSKIFNEMGYDKDSWKK